MQFAINLKKLLSGFVDVYLKYFVKTIKTAFLWTIFCFSIAALIGAFCDDYSLLRGRPISILGYFFSRYSYRDIYSFGDVVKTIFVFFVSIFSINLIRNQREANQSERLSNRITVKDIFYLLAILVTCVLLDCALFRLEGQLKHGLDNHNLIAWVSSAIFFLRIFLPLLLFALIIQISTSKTEFTFNKIIFLIISAWLFNEIAFEVTVFVRANIFYLLLSPLSDALYYWIESILGIGLIAVYFLGYSFAMVAPFKLVDNGGD